MNMLITLIHSTSEFWEYKLFLKHIVIECDLFNFLSIYHNYWF